MKPARIIVVLLLIGAASLFIVNRSCDRPERAQFSDRFTPERIQRYLSRKLDLNPQQQQQLERALLQRTDALTDLRTKATEVEPVFAQFRTQVSTFLTEPQVDALLRLMQDRRKDWKKAASVTDCTTSLPSGTNTITGPESKAQRAMQDITDDLALPADTTQQLQQALTDLFSGFQQVKSGIYPEFYALMDGVYADIDWQLSAHQQDALAEIRARRKSQECEPHE